MTGVWRFFDTEKDHPSGTPFPNHLCQSLEVILLDMLFVSVDEHLAKPGAVFLLDAILFVGFLLFIAYLLGGGELLKIGVADIHFRKPLLQALTVHKGVLAAANSTPLPDIAESVNPVLGQFVKKMMLCGTIYPNSKDFHQT